MTLSDLHETCTHHTHEDDLPEDIDQDLYDLWYDHSWVDGVRIGPCLECLMKHLEEQS